MNIGLGLLADVGPLSLLMYDNPEPLVTLGVRIRS
jgi:hypothetical protein